MKTLYNWAHEILDEYLPKAQRMIDSFTINPVEATIEPSLTLTPSVIEPDNSTSGVSVETAQVPSQNLSKPFLLQPRPIKISSLAYS